MSKFLEKNLIYFKYLILIFPILLISGPLIPEIVIFFSIFYFNIYFFFYKKNKIFRYQIFFCLIAWFTLIIGSLNSEYLFISLEKSLFIFRFFLFIFFLIFLFSYYDDLIIMIYNFLQIALVIIIIDSIFQYFFGFNILGMKYQFRLSSFFGDEYILGSYLSKFYALFLCLNFHENNRDNLLLNKKKLLKHAIIFCFIYFVIILTGERAAFIFLNSFILIFLFLKKQTRFLGYWFVILVIISNLFLYNFNEGFKGRFVESLKEQINLDFKNKDFFPKDYAGYFNTSLEIYKSNKIMGSGVRTFRHECKEYKNIINNSCNTHPHNYFFEILSETGLIGILIFFIFLIYFLKNLFKYLFVFKNKNYLAYLNLYILLLFQPITTTGSFFNNWNLCLNSFLLAIVLYSNNKVHNLIKLKDN